MKHNSNRVSSGTILTGSRMNAFKIMEYEIRNVSQALNYFAVVLPLCLFFVWDLNIHMHRV